MLYDNHMHTSFSGDSDANPDEMAATAKAKGLRGITFTDHIDFDYRVDPGQFEIEDMENYFLSHAATGQKYNDEQFEILTGIELGLQTQIAARNAEFVITYPFDVVIGSIHVVDFMDPYFDDYWKVYPGSKGHLKFYETTLENLKSFHDFDTLGHLDYIFRYNRTRNNPDTYTNFRDIVDAILEEIIKHDIALEINTGSFKSGMTYTNPMPSIIKRYKELGGKLITIGSDAHNTSHIALGFEKLPSLLKECGFDSYFIFKKRNATEIAI